MITQEQFNTIVKGLDAQNWRQSYSDEQDQCVYRTPDGLKCAIGQLIPDDQYGPDMDRPGEPWNARHFHEHGMLLNLSNEEIRVLQDLHDMADDPADMRERFRNFAADLKLEWPLP